MKYVAYYRVSTQKQGESGLGLEAQRQAVSAFAIDGPIIAEFTEVESGKNCERPEIAKAIAKAKSAKATLVVAKLDRLARNVSFIASLMDSDLEFVCCDYPYANRLTIHIMAAVAEDEARRTSERTKAALAALKAKGVKLGTVHPAHIARKGHETNIRRQRQRWIRHTAEFAQLVVSMYNRGFLKTEIATVLNMRGVTTPRGHEWNHRNVETFLSYLGLSAATPRSKRRMQRHADLNLKT